MPDTDFFPWNPKQSYGYIDDMIHTVERIHLSVDLDVLPASIMPAVSAPAARGLQLEVVETILTHILMTEKVAAVDLVELNPRFDIDSHGARLAAWLACQAVADWDRREDWE